MDDLLTIRLETISGVTVLHLEGALDASVSDALEAALTVAIAEAERRVHVDMARVTFLDSCALRELLLAKVRADQRQQLFAVRAMSIAVEKVLELTGSYEELTTDLVPIGRHHVTENS